jgi:LysR family transcriptional regulator, regulator for bpeEF and oprC
MGAGRVTSGDRHHAFARAEALSGPAELHLFVLFINPAAPLSRQALSSMDPLQIAPLFVRVVEAGNFTRAAKQMGITPSAASRRVAQLEDQLGVRLFHRTTRQMRLTEDGRAFYERCARIVTEFDEAIDGLSHARAEARGLLRVDAPRALGALVIAPALPTFLARHPSLHVDLTLRDHLVDPVVEGIDILVRIGEPRESSLTRRKLGEARQTLCGAPAYLKKRGKPRSAADLEKHARLGFLRHGRPTSWRFRGDDGAVVVMPVNGPVNLDDGELLRDAAIAGVGLVWLLDFIVAKPIAEGALVPLLDDRGIVTRPISALYPPNRHLSPKVRVFVDYLIEIFRTAAAPKQVSRSVRRQRS